VNFWRRKNDNLERSLTSPFAELRRQIASKNVDLPAPEGPITNREIIQ